MGCYSAINQRFFIFSESHFLVAKYLGLSKLQEFQFALMVQDHNVLYLMVVLMSVEVQSNTQKINYSHSSCLLKPTSFLALSAISDLNGTPDAEDTSFFNSASSISIPCSHKT